MEMEGKLQPRKKVTVKRKKGKKNQNEPPQPLTKRQELNNHIVGMRNTVAQARVHIICKLKHQIEKYKLRKGNEKDKDKARKKAERLVEEIHVLKKLTKDKVSLFALQIKSDHNLQAVLNKPDATLEERGLARLSHHPLLERDVRKYRDSNPNWDMQIPVLLRMTREKRKPKKDKNESETTSPLKTEPHTEQEEASKESEKEKDSVSDSDAETGSDNASDLEDNVEKCKPPKAKRDPAIIPDKVKRLSDDSIARAPDVDKTEGTVKVKFLTDLRDLENEISSSVEESSATDTLVDLTQAPKAKRPKSSFFVGGVDVVHSDDEKREGEWESNRSKTFNRAKPNQFDNDRSQSKPVYKRGKLISKPLAPPKRRGQPFNEERTDKRFSGNTEPLGGRGKFSSDSGHFNRPQQTFNNKPEEPTEKLHPSWEAKKKQQISLTSFQGKKITFDDDD